MEYDRILGAANELLRTGRITEALAAFDRILALDPECVEAHSHQGTALTYLGRSEEALASFDKAVSLNPNDAMVLSNRGNCLLSLGRHAEAVACYDTALSCEPELADAHLGRAKSLVFLGRYEEAIASCQAAVKIDQADAEAMRLHGGLLLMLSRLEEAVSIFGNFLTTHPNDVSTYIDLGIALSRLERHDEALRSYGHALALAPNNVVALYNRGNLLSAMQRFEDAAADCARVLDLDPNFDFARGNLLWAKLQCCDWDGLAEMRERIASDIDQGRRVLNPQQYLGIATSVESQYRCARSWARSESPAQAPIWNGERYQHDRIRLAYMSADYGEHATAHWIAGVFEHHDRKQFRTYAISLAPDDGTPMRRRLEASFDEFVDVAKMDDRQIAMLIHDLEIDILVDLKGYTQGARMNALAMRPAPIQVSYIGYPGTTGADYLDYVLADRFVIPREDFPSYSEKVVWLPDTYVCNDDKRHASGASPTRAQLGLPEDAFVFCCFNANYKILPATFDLWMQILAGQEGSVLWLLEPRPSAMHNLRREAQARGIEPSRLVFAPRASQDEHLSRLSHANLILDTLPYNAHTTAADALWAGVPVLTLIGSTFPARVAASLLEAIGLPELITRTPEEFVEMACRLCNDRAALGLLKKKLARNRQDKPLFDTAGFTRHLETALSTMWTRYCEGLAPMAFGVEADISESVPQNNGKASVRYSAKRCSNVTPLEIERRR